MSPAAYLDALGVIILTLLMVMSVAGAVRAVAFAVSDVRRDRIRRELRDARRAVDAFYR